MVLIAIVGTAGLAPALAAIRAGKDIAVASKEILVMAGEEVTREAAKHKVAILPVDSEHNAIFQCLVGEPPRHIRRLILTASGGPFRQTPASADLAKVTPAQALKHPTWNMGRKITIDSATLFNKGLEMIEARWLFGVPMDQVDVVVHPQSIVHSLVEFVDGSQLAQLSHSDMCFPIQYAVTYPDRLANRLKPLCFATMGSLTFEAPGPGEDFPRSVSPAKPARKAARFPPSSTPRTKSPCPRFSRAKSSFPPSGTPSRPSCGRIKTLSTPRSTRSCRPTPGPVRRRRKKSPPAPSSAPDAFPECGRRKAVAAVVRRWRDDQKRYAKPGYF